MTTTPLSSASFLIACFLSLSVGGHSAEKEPEKDPLRSPGGFRAEFVAMEGEGEGKTVIWKGKKKIAEILDSKPVSFSPTDDILLVSEYAADDDLRHYLLDLGKGEFKKEGNRLRYVFGGRYCNGARWSADGKTITLIYVEGLAAKPEEQFSVKELLER